MNERMEYWVKGDVRVDLPVAGVFELRDGLIVSWRDYFDLPTLQPLLDAVLG
jgi:limonene-1,2-epoxide hydrolase